jgi:hypothetical protein
MIINNLSSRLRPSRVSAAARRGREAERQRVKAETRALRTQAEKIAWHLADMASSGAAPVPIPIPVTPHRSRR